MRRILQVGPRGSLLTGVMVAVALAVAALFPGGTAEAVEPGGDYFLVLKCDTHSAQGVSFVFTSNGTPLAGGWTGDPVLECDAGEANSVPVNASADWNDFTFEYQCPKATSVKTLTVGPVPEAEADRWYDLNCESPGARFKIANPIVGGIADLPALAEGSAQSATPTDSSGWSTGAYAALAGVAAAALLALGGGAWYARRRWIR